MTTENRTWLTPGAVISTGRHTGMKQISMDTVDTIGDKLITTMGHQFDLNTLEAPENLAGMYQWRVADPESPQVKLDIAVQARERALTVVYREQASFEREPASDAAVYFLIQALDRYRATISEAEKLAEELKVTA